jgi:hypothetical protein
MHCELIWTCRGGFEINKMLQVFQHYIYHSQPHLPGVESNLLPFSKCSRLSWLDIWEWFAGLIKIVLLDVDEIPPKSVILHAKLYVEFEFLFYKINTINVNLTWFFSLQGSSEYSSVQLEIQISQISHKTVDDFTIKCWTQSPSDGLHSTWYFEVLV